MARIHAHTQVHIQVCSHTACTLVYLSGHPHSSSRQQIHSCTLIPTNSHQVGSPHINRKAHVRTHTQVHSHTSPRAQANPREHTHRKASTQRHQIPIEAPVSTHSSTAPPTPTPTHIHTLGVCAGEYSCQPMGTHIGRLQRTHLHPHTHTVTHSGF